MRQLKNITEQISIFETNREVDGATLQGYLPQYNIEKLPARQTATPGEQDHTFFEKERKMLYKTLFEMQKELADLHAKVEELTKAAQGQAHFTPSPQSVTVARSMALAPITTAVPVHVPASKGKTIDETEGEVIPNEAEYVEEQPTTLEDTERETIRKALTRYLRVNGKRRPRS